MKQIVTGLVMGLAAVLAAPAQDTSPAPETPAAGRIGLVSVGAVDDALMDRVAAHVVTHLQTEPRRLPARDAAGGDTLEAEAAALAPLVEGDLLCVVGVVAAPDTIATHGIVIQQQKVGAINATALRPDPEDAEAYGRRVEKEVLRAASLLLGLPPCPNPRCALFHYTNDEQLDNKGRNLCPPCQVKYEKMQAERPMARP